MFPLRLKKKKKLHLPEPEPDECKNCPIPPGRFYSKLKLKKKQRTSDNIFVS